MDTWMFIKDIFILSLSISSTALITSLFVKKKNRKEFEQKISRDLDNLEEKIEKTNKRVDNNFVKIIERIELIVKAMMISNGYGQIFTENYDMLINEEEQRRLKLEEQDF